MKRNKMVDGVEGNSSSNEKIEKKKKTQQNE